MDGDDFSRATRLGRTAVAAIWESISNDVPFDGFATGQLIDRFVGHAEGIPSLRGILSILADLAAEPLFVQARTDEAIDRVHEVADGDDCTMLDLQLRDVVTSALVRNEIAPLPILVRFFKVPLGAEPAPGVARSQTIEMYRRYAAEIDYFLIAARPTLHARTPRPAKEVVHDLFAAAR